MDIPPQIELLEGFDGYIDVMDINQPIPVTMEQITGDNPPAFVSLIVKNHSPKLQNLDPYLINGNFPQNLIDLNCDNNLLTFIPLLPEETEFLSCNSNLISNFTNIANANSFFSGLDSLLQNGPKSLVNISSPTITAYYSSLGIPNVPSVIYGIAGTLFQTNFLDYASSLSDPGNPAGIIIPAAYPITIGVDIYQAVPPPTNQLTIYNMISATTTTLSAGSNFSVNGLTFRFLGAGSPGLCVIVY